MNPTPPRTRVHIVCKDLTATPHPTGLPQVIEVATFQVHGGPERLVNEMGTWEFNRTTIEDIEDAIVQAGCRAGVRSAKLTVERVVEGGIGITRAIAKLGYA